MKTRFLTVVLSTVFMFTATQSFAQDGVGLGGELLSPVGLSFKVPINESSAITGAFGFFVTDGFNNSRVEINYLSFINNDNIDIGSGDLNPYIGAGLSFRFAEGLDPSVSLRVPFGIEYIIDNSPIEVYMDIGPFLTVTDPLSFSFDSSLGFRYRF
jgi:hypothetical protein